jgi:hypothetical protein
MQKKAEERSKTSVFQKKIMHGSLDLDGGNEIPAILPRVTPEFLLGFPRSCLAPADPYYPDADGNRVPGNLRGLQRIFEVFATRAHLRQKKQGS